MSQVGGLSQYQSHNVSGSYASLVRGGKTAPIDIRNPQPEVPLAKVSSAGDTLKVSSTSQTRAQVNAANAKSQTAQAGITTARVVESALDKTAGVLKEMTSVVDKLSDKQLAPKERGELRERFTQLSQQLEDLSEQEKFAGHRLLDGNFKVTFTMNADKKVTIDATLPNGKSFNTEGLGLKALTQLVTQAEVELPANPALAKAQELKSQANLHKQLPQLTKGLQVSLEAVNQVKNGVSGAAISMIQTLSGANAPFGAPVGGASQMAHNLVAATRANVLADASAAFGAQANISASSAMHLMV